jgi:hypothetical protein
MQRLIFAKEITMSKEKHIKIWLFSTGTIHIS